MKMIQTSGVFDVWFAKLNDQRARARITARLRRMELGNFGDVQAVGQGVSELRIDCGPGYRVYFVLRGLEIIILLAGGDKSTQVKDIQKALRLARQI